MNLPKNEPVMVLVTAVIGATAAVLIAFGVHLTDDQVKAIEALAYVVTLSGLYVRSRVTPTAKVPVVPAALPPAPAGDIDPVP